MRSIKESVFDINKVDIPIKAYGDVEEYPERCPLYYRRASSFSRVQLLLKATDDPARFVSSVWLDVIDPLARKDPFAFGNVVSWYFCLSALLLQGIKFFFHRKKPLIGLKRGHSLLIAIRLSGS
jgi:hypothetical protein